MPKFIPLDGKEESTDEDGLSVWKKLIAVIRPIGIHLCQSTVVLVIAFVGREVRRLVV